MANVNRINGIIDRVSNAEKFNDIKWILDEPVINLSESVVDKYVETNMKFQSRAGIKTTAVRVIHGETCRWCRNLAGSYEIDDLPDNFFARHENCDCTISYKGKKMSTSGHGFIDQSKTARKERIENAQSIDNRLKENSSKELRLVKEKWKLGISSGSDIENTTRRELGTIPTNNIKNAVDFFKNQLRNLENENAIIIQSNGKIVHFIGNKNNVGVFDVDLKNAHVIHNHTEITSFGSADYFVMQQNQSAIYDLVDSMYDYRIEIIKDISELSYNDLYKNLKMSIEDIVNGDYQHLVMQELRDRGYANYTRTPIK